MGAFSVLMYSRPSNLILPITRQPSPVNCQLRSTHDHRLAQPSRPQRRDIGQRLSNPVLPINRQLSRHFLKPLVIILPSGTHQPIPKGKVQAIVALEVLVVLVVVYRSIEPFAQPMAVGTLGKEFVAEVAIYIVQRHEYQKHHDVCKMNGDGKGKYIDDARLYNGLGRAKSKRGPRRWVGAFVVQQVKEFE